MTTQFHRTLVETGYIIIHEDSWEWNKFDLPQLLRKTVTSEEEMVPTDYHHTIYELEGDMADLSAVANTELLDKKIATQPVENSKLDLKNKSLIEELELYLNFIKIKNTDEILNEYKDLGINV